MFKRLITCVKALTRVHYAFSLGLYLNGKQEHTDLIPLEYIVEFVV